jgi:hypothetical protein
MRTRCGRCGAEQLDDQEIAAVLRGALAEIDRAKLRWPCGVAGELRTIEKTMRCRAGTCGERG